MHPVGSISIVGLGKIGGSLAAALTRRGLSVSGYDDNAGAVRTALDRGLIVSGAKGVDEAVANRALVILATPVRTILRQIPGVVNAMRPGAVLMDVGSSKKAIVSTMNRHGGGVRCFGGHPIAGSSLHGADAWDADLFIDRTFVVVPTDSSTPDSWNIVDTILSATGCRVRRMDAATHDAVIARTSHLPMLAGAAMMNVADRLTHGGTSELPGHDAETIRELAGGQFRASTRLTHLDPEMVADLMETNAAHIAEACREFVAEIETMANAVRAGTLQTLLDGARRRKERILC